MTDADINSMLDMSVPEMLTEKTVVSRIDERYQDLTTAQCAKLLKAVYDQDADAEDDAEEEIAREEMGMG